MSVSKRETANAVELSTGHQDPVWNERPGRSEMPVTPWQQGHTQSSSDEEGAVPPSLARAVSEG